MKVDESFTSVLISLLSHFCSFVFNWKYKIAMQYPARQYKTLPEAQRTQGIKSITQIITHGKYHFGDEMIYMCD